MKLSDLCRLGAAHLEKVCGDRALEEARFLLAECLQESVSTLWLSSDREIPEGQVKKFLSWVEKRVQHEPYGYIVGYQDFLGIRLKIDSRVLSPRQETEILAEKLMDLIGHSKIENPIVWDLCTGSGCIGLSVKAAFPKALVTLSDISSKALSLAKENAKSLNLDVRFLEGDLFEPFPQAEKAHFIVINPPYLSQEEYDNSEPELKKEPIQALLADQEGLECYQKIAKKLFEKLYPQGKALLEMGKDQGKALYHLFSSDPWVKKRIEADWAGLDRFFFLEKE